MSTIMINQHVVAVYSSNDSPQREHPDVSRLPITVLHGIEKRFSEERIMEKEKGDDGDGEEEAGNEFFEEVHHPNSIANLEPPVQ